MLDEARRARLDKIRGVGGIGVIPRFRRAESEPTGLRERVAAFRDRLRGFRDRLTALRDIDPDTLRRRVTDTLPHLRRVWREQRERDYRALLREHRVLLAGMAAVLVFAAADVPGQVGFAEQGPGPGRAQRVVFAHPQDLQNTPLSVRRYLAAIANGERIREQAVVAAAARATLERARAEAAAAVAGEALPWISAGGVPLPPGSIAPGAGGFVLPAIGLFTSGFGSRWGTMHNGIDIAAPIGTPIYAVAAGTVIDAGPAQGFGLWVRIRHDDGTITVYGHMYDFFVSVGERVPAGMQIARMGNRGDSTGPHLHFEVIQGGGYVDPAAWLAQRGLGLG